MSGGEGRKARQDLMSTVESQAETIVKYEKRLKDVVTAYKGLAKEKEALEESFKAVTGADVTPTSREKEGTDAESETGSVAGSAASEDQSRLREKVKTLSKTVMTLTSEKSRLETSFQEDRKKLLSEKKDREAKVSELTSELDSLKEKASADKEEAKSKLIVERHAREKEASDQQLMLREMQKVLSEERREKEKVETELQETQGKIRSLELSSSRLDTSFEGKITSLEAKLKAKSEEAERLRVKLKLPSPEAEKLRSEVREAKEQHRKELEREGKRVEEAEQRATKARLEQEQRVTSLESRLGELSETVGTYDRLRTHDQGEIQKLKDKICLLGEENANILSSSRSGSNSPSEGGSKDEFKSLDISTLMDKFKLIKDRLREANKSSVAPIDLEDFFSDDEITLTLRRQLDALRRELESYKRGQRGSPTGKYLLTEVDQEVVHSLKMQASDSDERAQLLSRKVSELNSEVALGKKREALLSEEVLAERDEGEKKVEAVEAEYKAKISDLEAEFQKQRDRCMTMIEEKEDEVAMLKSNMELAFETAFSQPDTKAQLKYAASNLARSVSVASSSSGRRSRKHSHVTGHADSLLDDVDGLKSSNQNDGMVLHYEQDISHKTVEIQSLRKKVFEVESAMRELQMSFVVKEERFADRLDNAQDEIARLKRRAVSSGKDGGASMEYLKNVVFNYMTSSEANSSESSELPGLKPLKSKPYSPDDFHNLTQLSAAGDDATDTSFNGRILANTAAVTMLLFYLRKSGYFGTEAGRERDLTPAESMIGRLLHRLLLVAERNTHQFSQIEEYTPAEGVKLAPLGCALNPTLAMVNHSCDPNTMRCNIGTRTVLVATKNLMKGDEITDCYSVPFQDVDVIRRKKHLADNYGFECRCQACVENWPLFMEIRKSVTRPGVHASKIEEAKKMFMSLSHVTGQDFQSGYFDRIVDMWAGYYGTLNQAILPPHKCYLRVYSNVLDCFWLKYGNRVPKLDAPAFKDHKVEADMRQRGDGDELEEGKNLQMQQPPQSQQQGSKENQEKAEKIKEMLAKMKKKKQNNKK